MKTYYLVLISLLFEVNCVRWSRQIADADISSEINEWIPLTEPCSTCQSEDRSKNAKDLNYYKRQTAQNVYASHNSHPFTSVGQPFQYQRFGFAQEKQTELNYSPQQPTSQSFFQFEMPAFHSDGNHQHSLPSVQTGYQIHHSGPQQPMVTSPLFSQKPAFPFEYPPQLRPQHQSLTHQKNIQQNFVDYIKKPFKERNIEPKPNKQLDSLPPLKQTPYQQLQFQSQKAVPSFQTQIPFETQSNYRSSIPNSTPQEDEIQLLYVPYDTLYQQRDENLNFANQKYNLVQTQVNPEQINNFYTPEPQNTVSITTTSTTKPSTTYQPRLHLTKTKPKPHQPPLAMFMIKSMNQPDNLAINEVLTALQSEKSIAVLDSPSVVKTPSVFIGPSGLPVPSGYTKFDLPYLSNIDSNHIDRHPFYVAPLSYRVPLGFTKIALPEPHVGSLIVNRPIDNVENSIVQQDIQQINQFSQKELSQTYETPPVSHINHYPAEYTTEPNYYPSESSTLPQPQKQKNQIKYQLNPDDQAGPQSPYSQFKTIPKHTVNEEYFSARKVSQPSTPSAASLTSTTIPSYQYQPNVKIEITPSISTNLGSYQDGVPSVEKSHFKMESQQNYGQVDLDEEYKIKTYFQGQEAYKTRPTIQTTTSNPLVENVQYTPVSVDYDNRFYKFPTSTSSYLDISTVRPTQKNEKITFYTPVAQVVEETSSPATYPTKTITTTVAPVPENQQPSYNSNIFAAHNLDENSTETEQDLEFDPNPYELPSELPPLTPNLPGLVNGLIEKEKLNGFEKETMEALTTTTTTTSITQQPFLRPIKRGRRPSVTKTSMLVSYSSEDADTTTRHSIIRGRRPYNPRTTSSSAKTTPRTPVIRNPNKIRYSPSPEERQYLRQKTRSNTSSKTNSRKNQKEEDNIEYQRDVLKQNYPVFKSSVRTIAETTPASSTSEAPEQSFEQTASPTSIDDKDNTETFAGLLEPMQIAQEYQQVSKENYGPGYFPSEETSVTQVPLRKKEVRPIYTTTPVVPDEITTRRAPLNRRTYRPAKTTTPAPLTTTLVPDERYTVRPRSRPENGIRPRIVKIKGRVRKPHPASTTTSAPLETTSESSYQQVKRFNQDFYQDDYREKVKIEHQQQKYTLDTQESQWSPSLSRSNGFHPIDHEQRAVYLKKSNNFEDEPEIVTAGSDLGEPNNGDSFLFNVSAGFGSLTEHLSESNKSKEKNVANTTSTSFMDMLKEVMADTTNSKEVSGEDSSQIKTSFTGEKRQRKGVWKRVKVQKNDSFETAESQNIGTQLVNSILKEDIVRYTAGKIDIDSRKTLKDNIPESITVDSINSALYETSTSKPDYDISSTAEPEEITTLNGSIPITLSTAIPISNSIYKADINTDSPESESSSIDSDKYDESIESVSELNTQVYEEEDLETQASLFDEVRSQLGTLFAIEEPSNDRDSKSQPTRQKYTTIQRTRTNYNSLKENNESGISSTTENSPFHKNLMNSIVHATSTSTEVSYETEICYRGRCIKSNKSA